MAEEKEGEGNKGKGKRSRLSGAARRMDSSPRLVTVVKRVRELLPGDSRFGDPLSTAGKEGPQVVGRRLAELTAERPGVLREAGLSALQVWQSVSEAQGRERGDEELAIVFTDLVEFSDWALDAGDEAALDLLRDVGEAVELPVNERDGTVVKRLGDGLMAVFEDPKAALAAMLQARDRLEKVQADGYQPRMRAGIHVGKPRCLGGDYLGLDVTVAARLAEQAEPNELLVSEPTLSRIDRDALEVDKRRKLKVKGVPKELVTYSVTAKS